MRNGLSKWVVLMLALLAGFPALGAQASVARSVFTSAIRDREPAETLQTLSEGVERLYYFTELTGLSGQTVKHRWEHNGQVISEVSFEVKADRWRVWSSKEMTADMLTGEWTVVVVDGGGNELKRDTLSAANTAAQPSAPASAAQ